MSILIQHDEEKQLEQEEDPAEGGLWHLGLSVQNTVPGYGLSGLRFSLNHPKPYRGIIV